MILLQSKEEGEKIIVLLEKEIWSLQPVKQWEAINQYLVGSWLFSVSRGVRKF